MVGRSQSIIQEIYEFFRKKEKEKKKEKGKQDNALRGSDLQTPTTVRTTVNPIRNQRIHLYFLELARRMRKNETLTLANPRAMRHSG